jgi:hypothetical protein
LTIWAWDIETAHWDEFVSSVAVSDRGETLVHRTPKEVRDWYTTTSKTDRIIAHNGGRFDFLFMISLFPEAEWQLLMAGSTIVTGRIPGLGTLQDSKRLFPISLADWTRQKSETGLECVCGKSCGGYCAIRTDLPKAQMDRLTEYNVNDAQILLDHWIKDRAQLEADGLMLRKRGTERTTIGAVAWLTACTLAGIKSEAPSWQDYRAGREAYAGGKVQVYSIKEERIKSDDVNSMYPYTLTLDVPIGERVTLTGAAARRAYLTDDLCLVRAKVVVPDREVVLLPHRAYPGSGEPEGRLMWATGVITGTWTAHELRWAESNGARIISIEYVYQWSSRAPIFQPYMEHMFARRRAAKERGDDRWATVLKFALNSLSGKLAQRVVTHSTKVLPRGQRGTEGDRWDQIGGPESRVWSVPRDSGDLSPPACGLTWCAATLTGRARVILGTAEVAGEGTIVYDDTDGLKSRPECPDPQPADQKELGAWKREGVGTDWSCIAPKVYRYVDEDGCPVIRAKGFPIRYPHEHDTPERIKALNDHNERVYASLQRGEAVTWDNGVALLRRSGGAWRRSSVSRRVDPTTRRVGTRFLLGNGPRTRAPRWRGGRYV